MRWAGWLLAFWVACGGPGSGGGGGTDVVTDGGVGTDGGVATECVGLVPAPSGTAIAFGFGRQFDRFRRDGTWDIAFRLEKNEWNGTVSPQLVVRQAFETPERYAELRTRFAVEWESKQLSPDGEAIFEELGLADGTAWRSLLESERFRELLAEPALAKAA